MIIREARYEVMLQGGVSEKVPYNVMLRLSLENRNAVISEIYGALEKKLQQGLMVAIDECLEAGATRRELRVETWRLPMSDYGNDGTVVCVLGFRILRHMSEAFPQRLPETTSPPPAGL